MSEKKVLIVDYDIQSLDALALLFKPYKIQVIKAQDGQSAYEKFKEEKPDLIVLEAILPKIHGFDLTKRISQETSGSIPIVIVTGLYRGPQYKHEALSSFGAADYFEKPVDKDKFVQSILGLLKEEEDLGDELPDATSVIENLTQRIRPHTSLSEKE